MQLTDNKTKFRSRLIKLFFIYNIFIEINYLVLLDYSILTQSQDTRALLGETLPGKTLFMSLTRVHKNCKRQKVYF